MRLSILPKKLLLIATGVALLVVVEACANQPRIESGGEYSGEYSEEALERIRQWQALIDDYKGRPVMEKLEQVNQFFNQLYFVSDQRHWGKNDYWATPTEFLATNGGDCEDFTIAKYFTLKEMGVDINALRLTYVKALKPNPVSQSHMVLTYYETPDAVPLVLDNLVKTIMPASMRRDLVPVYSFNGEGLWLAKERGQGRFVGSSGRLSRWKELLNRMRQK